MKNKLNNIPTIIISGSCSGAGKTSLTIGIIAALKARGLKVQPFKVGPDFIDITHHTRATGRICRNLDGWMLPESAVIEIFQKNAADADIAVIEGVAGLFDGYGGNTDEGSTAQISKILGVPVVLVIDAGAMSRSVGALVLGYDSFDPDVRVNGVIFNKVASQNHLKMLKDSVNQNTEVTVLGGIGEYADIQVKERHLGLLMSEEDKLKENYINKLAELIEDKLDLDKIISMAKSGITRQYLSKKSPTGYFLPVKIGVARDEAFCFYYQDNLDLLRELGAELVEFSPLKDKLPDNLDAIYFGGGYPEIYAEKLSQNTQMLESVKAFAEADGVIYGECGGLMYLGSELDSFPMTRVFPYKTQMTKKLKLNYTEINTLPGIKIFPENSKIRGHLFHYSSIINDANIKKSYRATTASGEFLEGYTYRNTLASYIHLHFWSNLEFVKNFIRTLKQ